MLPTTQSISKKTKGPSTRTDTTTKQAIGIGTLKNVVVMVGLVLLSYSQIYNSSSVIAYVSESQSVPNTPLQLEELQLAAAANASTALVVQKKANGSNLWSSEAEVSKLLNSTSGDRIDSDKHDIDSDAISLLASFFISPWLFFILLVLQCGVQPILVKKFIPTHVVRSTAIMAQECAKLVLSLTFLMVSQQWQASTQSWTFESAVKAAGVPAFLYVVQNYCNLTATQMLPPITFSVLNQTKTLSAAFCCFILMGNPQSHLQLVALILLVVAALVTQRIISIQQCTQSALRVIQNS
jgi:hypothetical protein